MTREEERKSKKKKSTSSPTSPPQEKTNKEKRDRRLKTGALQKPSHSLSLSSLVSSLLMKRASFCTWVKATE